MTQNIDSTNWRESALCAQIDVGDIFYPELGQSGEDAKRICRICPVSQWCLNEALTADEWHGIWGGTSPKERRRIRRDRLPHLDTR